MAFKSRWSLGVASHQPNGKGDPLAVLTEPWSLSPIWPRVTLAGIGPRLERDVDREAMFATAYMCDGCSDRIVRHPAGVPRNTCPPPVEGGSLMLGSRPPRLPLLRLEPHWSEGPPSARPCGPRADRAQGPGCLRVLLLWFLVVPGVLDRIEHLGRPRARASRRRARPSFPTPTTITPPESAYGSPTRGIPEPRSISATRRPDSSRSWGLYAATQPKQCIGQRSSCQEKPAFEFQTGGVVSMGPWMIGVLSARTAY